MCSEDCGCFSFVCEYRDGRVECYCAAKYRTELGVGLDAPGSDSRVGDVGSESKFVEIVPVLVLVWDIGVVGAERKAVVVGFAVVAADDTVLLIVAEGKEVSNLLGTAAYAELVLLDRGVVVEGLVLPVGTLACGCNLCESVERSVAVIGAGLVHDGHVFLCVEDFFLPPWILPSVASVICNGGFALFAGPGSDEHYAVGCTGTVDCCGSGILEDFH